MPLEEIDLAEMAVEMALGKGADYAEARLQSSKGVSCILKNGQPEPPGYSDSKGMGVRIGVKGALVFCATNTLTRKAIGDLVVKGTASARALGRKFTSGVGLSREKDVKMKWAAPEKKKFEDTSVEDMARIMAELDREAFDARGGKRAAASGGKAGKGKSAPGGLAFRLSYMGGTLDEKFIVTSSGTRIESRVPRIYMFSMLTAAEGDRMAQRMLQYGQTGGTEAVKRIDPAANMAAEKDILIRVLREAKAVKPGKVNVLVGPEVAGIMSHEAIGHPQEADRILGREAAQAGESYLTDKDMGKVIGSKQAVIRDDPTIEHSYGFYLYDDEGVKAGVRTMLDRGKVTDFLHNRQTAAVFGKKSNGSARAMGYDREPIVRMANTYVEKGDRTMDELLDEMKDGIYIRNFMEWNIDDKRLNQRYVGHEAYQVKGGEIRGLVRNPVLEINTPALWSSVLAREKKIEFTAATCGKGDPMQGAPVWMGGPHMLLGNVALGGR